MLKKILTISLVAVMLCAVAIGVSAQYWNQDGVIDSSQTEAISLGCNEEGEYEIVLPFVNKYYFENCSVMVAYNGDGDYDTYAMPEKPRTGSWVAYFYHSDGSAMADANITASGVSSSYDDSSTIESVSATFEGEAADVMCYTTTLNYTGTTSKARIDFYLVDGTFLAAFEITLRPNGSWTFAQI